MTIHTSWYDESQSVIYNQYPTAWTYRAHRETISQNRMMIAESPVEAVHIITHLAGGFIHRGNRYEPLDMLFELHPGLGQGIIVTPSPLMQEFALSFVRAHMIGSDRYMIVPSLEDAVATL
jgi:hypothetical protein